eukprot:RCo030638
MEDVSHFPLWGEDEPLEDYLRRLQQAAAEDVAHQSFSGLSWVATALQKFVCENFTGPPLEASSLYPKVELANCALSAAQQSLCLSWLQVDGEPAFAALRRPFLLVSAVTVVEALSGNPTELALWQLRTYFVWQRVLSRATSTLRRKLTHCGAMLMRCIEHCGNAEICGVPAAQVMLELGLVEDHYHEVDQAEKMFRGAQKLTG